MVGGPEEIVPWGPEESVPSSNGHDVIPLNNDEDNMVPQATEILLAPQESE
jgi:hypothetical protein